MTGRDQAIRASWIACGEPVPYPQWWSVFSEWEVQPVEVDGSVVGAVMAKGAEIHVAVLPEHHKRWCTPKLYRWAITDRLKQYGQLFTSGKADNEFIRRAGFQPVGEFNGTTLYSRR